MADDETKLPEPSKLPSKVYFRIGEVASLVGVEPHVLRYWEREFRTIRPKKSARGQRVYSRKDVETLMRVRQLLYSEGFTIAGARRRLQQERTGHSLDVPMPADESELESASDVVASASPMRDRDDEAEAGNGDGARTRAPASNKTRERASESVPLFESAGPLFERARSDDGRGAELLAPPVARRAPAVVTRPERIEAPSADAATMRAALRELRGEIEAFLGDLGAT